MQAGLGGMHSGLICRDWRDIDPVRDGAHLCRSERDVARPATILKHMQSADILEQALSVPGERRLGNGVKLVGARARVLTEPVVMVFSLSPKPLLLRASVCRALIVHAHAGSPVTMRSEEHTSELQSLMRNSYAVFCLKKKNSTHTQ